MFLATTLLNNQKRQAFFLLWRRLLLAAVFIPSGITTIAGGAKSTVTGDHGLIRLINLLLPLSKKYPVVQKWLPIFVAVIFLILGAIFLFQAGKYAWQMILKHTLLGSSIVQQAKTHESLSDALKSIDTDMERGFHSFEGVFIGREWILGPAAMRLSRIKGMFSLDNGKNDYSLCCVDDDKNVFPAILTRREDRDSVEEYLKKTLSNIVTGNVFAYTAFLMDALDNPQMMALPPDAAFALVKPDGIPTSNFTYEEARAALDSLSPSQSIALKPLNGGKTGTEEISFACREYRQWEITVICREDDIQWPMVKLADEQEAMRILEDLIKEKSFRAFSHGTGADNKI